PRPKYAWGAPMECVNCLSKQARVRRPLTFWDYVWSPLILPINCPRCLQRWRFPTVLVGLEKLIDLLDSDRRGKS
ncbi:MAG TPA: hypothetical protein VIK18_24415, partial [Pirellulales bacterium]